MILTPPGIVAPYIKDLPGAPVLAPCFARRELPLANVGNNKGMRVLVSQTFNTAGAHPWTAPLTTLALEMLNGNGAAGDPEVEASDSYDYEKTVTTYDSSNQITAGPTTTYGSDSGYPPENYCSGVFAGGSGGGSRTETCYQYFYTGTAGQPATTGQSASAFDVSFPGGYGGAASPVTVTANIHIKPGDTYYIVVPPGGSVTFSYYQ